MYIPKYLNNEIRIYVIILKLHFLNLAQNLASKPPKILNFWPRKVVFKKSFIFI